MNLNRRTLLTGLAAGGAGALIRPARAQSWQAQFPELVFAVVPAENARTPLTNARREIKSPFPSRPPTPPPV